MSRHRRTRAERVVDEAGRRHVVDVLRATYQSEKRWITDPERQAPPEDLARSDIAWFVASVRGRPAGVVRVHYDPPLALYAKYGLKPLDTTIDVEDFIRRNRIAEIGRFAVVPRYRRRFTVAAALMRAATSETVARGYTHFVTDVFEEDPHSPYHFHTTVMGFLPVATHEVGELQCSSRRITLVLDLKAAYLRLKTRGNWLYRYLTEPWDNALHRRMAA
jgi:Acetyltransferase (GNAT) family